MASKRSKFREYTEAILIALLLALFIRTFAVQAFKIPSGSMEHTLEVGDHILVNKFLYGLMIPYTDSRFLSLRQPRRGDIIVFSFPENRNKKECSGLFSNLGARVENALNNNNPVYLFKDECRDFIKRIVGIGGDTVEIRDRSVYINGTALEESYTVKGVDRPMTHEMGPRDNFSTTTVPLGKFFVMGDNRDHSYDSRFWGFVDINDIKGKAFIIYWSWNKEENWFSKVRWGRISKLIR